MKVAQTEVLSLVDDDGVGIRYINTVFYDASAYQHIIITINEIHNHLFHLFATHLSVTNAGSYSGAYFAENIFDRQDVFHLIVNKENLSTSLNFTIDDFSYGVFVEINYFCGYRQSVRRGSADD